MKKKQMSKAEFSKIAERQWVPVMLIGDGRPEWMRNIPEERTEFILASGTFIDPRLIELNGLTLAQAVGGIDVYRYDEKDVSKGYPYNKDHYILVLDPTNNNALLVHGPVKDKNGHWIEKLPNLPDDITIIESTKD